VKKKVSNYVHEYLVKNAGDEHKIEKFSMFLEEFFTEMTDEYEDVREAFYEELEDFTDEIDETMLHTILENLRRKDGVYSGVKWSKEEVEGVAKQYDVKAKVENYNKTYDITKFWFALNYVYAVHNSINRTINGYIDLAIDEMTNKNICFDDLIRRIFKKI
jgi:hypothetical protein